MEFKYQTKVKVVSGFYMGQVGVLKEEYSTWVTGKFQYRYMIEIDNSTYPIIPKECLELIKE